MFSKNQRSVIFYLFVLPAFLFTIFIAGFSVRLPSLFLCFHLPSQKSGGSHHQLHFHVAEFCLRFPAK